MHVTIHPLPNFTNFTDIIQNLVGITIYLCKYTPTAQRSIKSIIASE